MGESGDSSPSRHCMFQINFDHVGVLVGVGTKVDNRRYPSIWPLPLLPANATSIAPVTEHVFKTLRGHLFVERGHLISQVVAQIFHFDLKFPGLRPGPGKITSAVVVHDVATAPGVTFPG